jgi:hypothetical protein
LRFEIRPYLKSQISNPTGALWLTGDRKWQH